MLSTPGPVTTDDLGRPGLPRALRLALTIPGMILAGLVYTALFPLLLVAALLVDLVRAYSGAGLATLRVSVYGLCFFWAHILGLTRVAWVGLSTWGAPARRIDKMYVVQDWFLGLLLSTAGQVFGIRFDVEGDEHVTTGPTLVFVRHASLVDVLVPSVFVGKRHGIRLRYILKRELLLNPCIDIAGHWLPNHFVERDGHDTERELGAIRALKHGLRPDEGVVIYPEGTRFTQAKRARILEKLVDDPETRARASQLRHLLPARNGGPQALLEEPPACDVLFVGHDGLEGFSGMTQIWSGALQGTHVRVKFWRAQASEIPQDRAARQAWLAAHWQRLDDWLESLPHKQQPAG